MSDIRRYACFFSPSGKPMGEPVRLADDPETFELDIPPGAYGVEYFGGNPETTPPFQKVHFVSEIFSVERAEEYHAAYAENLETKGIPIGMLVESGLAKRLITPVPAQMYHVLGTHREFLMPPDFKVALTVEDRQDVPETAPQSAFRKANLPAGPAGPKQGDLPWEVPKDYFPPTDTQIVPVEREIPRQKGPAWHPGLKIPD